MNTITKYFINATEPRPIDNFIESSDMSLAIDFTDFLESRNLMWGDQNLRAYNCDYNEAVYLAKKYSKKIFDVYNSSPKLYVHYMGLIKYKVGAWMEVHNDKMDEQCSECELSAVMYLNDNYEGGEIIFPNLKKQYHPKSGSCISYPSLWTDFDHGVNKVTAGTRYSMAWCFTSNKEKAFKPYLQDNL
jgi:hypothetical protein